MRNVTILVILAFCAFVYFFGDPKVSIPAATETGTPAVPETKIDLASAAIAESAAESERLQASMRANDQPERRQENQFQATVDSQSAIDGFVGTARALRLQAIADANRAAEDARAAKLKEVEDAKEAKLQEIEDAKQAKIAAIEDAKLAKSQEVSVSNLAVQSHRYDGKVIVTRLNCFFADASEYRCLGASKLRIDFASLDNSDDLDKYCDDIDKLYTSHCSVRVRFTYKGCEDFDIDGSTRITRVIADLDSGEILPN